MDDCLSLSVSAKIKLPEEIKTLAVCLPNEL